MTEKGDLWKKELWTQSEVAEYFRVVPGTVKNWRERGLLGYWQAPGSTRVLYFRDEVRNFRNHNAQSPKGGDKTKKASEKIKGKPVISSTLNEDWRI
jgi:hypothetical protein